jgi:hypothetical protein
MLQTNIITTFDQKNRANTLVAKDKQDLQETYVKIMRMASGIGQTIKNSSESRRLILHSYRLFAMGDSVIRERLCAALGYIISRSD